MMFNKYILNLSNDSFDQLSSCIQFENITDGRKGAVLAQINSMIPIVRTTTIYKYPIQNFQPIHNDLIQQIKDVTEYAGLNFNNALIEIYDFRYYNMKFHSDQALDLDENSYICVFSCYSEKTHLRKLKIKEKNKNNDLHEIILDHNSIVIFSVETNRKYLHKIIAEKKKSGTARQGGAERDKWLGITFRLSKTYIYFRNELPYFYSNDEQMISANEQQTKEFYKCRALENSQDNYIYLNINYTISPSDLMVPNNLHH